MTRLVKQYLEIAQRFRGAFRQLGGNLVLRGQQVLQNFAAVFIRQPIPGNSFLSGHIEAIIDLRNLLAQGYVPVLDQDGQTVYLVQSARSVRGGLSFNF